MTYFNKMKETDFSPFCNILYSYIRKYSVSNFSLHFKKYICNKCAICYLAAIFFTNFCWKCCTIKHTLFNSFACISFNTFLRSSKQSCNCWIKLFCDRNMIKIFAIQNVVKNAFCDTLEAFICRINS